MKFIPGLVSISFRSLSASDLINYTVDSGLKAIEWGGDVHVPAGDIRTAERVYEACLTADIIIPEYGSYYRIGDSAPDDFGKVLSCAKALCTDCIRVWAYNTSGEGLRADTYSQIVEDARRICDMAPEFNICLECHNHTLTEDYRSALKFLQDVNRTNLKMFWQPNQYRSHKYNIEALRALLPYIRAVHVFSWEGDRRLPLRAHKDRWREYLDILKGSECNRIPLMLEFMHDDRIESLHAAAEALLAMTEN